MRPRVEVADIVRAHGAEHARTHQVSAEQRRVLGRLVSCRTADLGGHVDRCVQCGHERVSYHSCRDRHCPKCQALPQAAWLEQRLSRLLPVSYFHVVFTLPAEINALALRNPTLIYDLLFRSASQTLLRLTGDHRRLGVQPGITAVLHTWGQNLMLHPHVHCVVTGGGLCADGSRWSHGKKGYFLPVKVLGSLYRGKFLDGLHRAWKAGKIALKGSTAELADPVSWAAYKDRLYQKDWVVYAKRPFGGADQVFRYLGRYTHRVAISNHRLQSLSADKVTFTLKDYADDGRRKTMTLTGVEFLRRFLLHVLPKGFVRIRHYGLNAPCNVKTRLEMARRHLEKTQVDRHQPSVTLADLPWHERFLALTGIDVMACPRCGGRLVIVEPLVSMPARAPGGP